MCKHVLNAQVSIRSPCCKKWFDCAQCHQEQEDHQLLQRYEMVFACKKCKKCFRKDAQEFDERYDPALRATRPFSYAYFSRVTSDEYCPHCDNHFVIDAVTPKPALKVEGEDARIDSRMFKDERLRQEGQRSIFDVKDAPDRLG
ncbi:MAG: hypothetical protein Q9157_005618 [Trypethelium eluteriae]